MKKYLILIGGILLLLLGIGLGTIGVATIVMIIQSGSTDGLNIALGVIMLVFVVAAVSMILKGGKLIRNTRKEINLQNMMEKQENKNLAEPLMEMDYGSNRWYVMEEQENKKIQGDRNGKVWLSVGLLLAAVACIGLLFVFRGAAVQTILIMVCAACMIVFGIIQGDRIGKVWKVCLLFAAVASIGLLFVFQGFAKTILMLVGTTCMIVLGIIRGIEFNRSGKCERPGQMERVMALPVMVYWLIAFSICEYVVGW